jgi:hypothetical protein
MAGGVLPLLKSIYLCDYHIGYENGKVDLYGLINAIRPEQYPFRSGRFCVFAQLVNGLGQTPFFFDVRQVSTHQLIYVTHTNTLTFPDRTTIVQLAMDIRGCPFPEPDLYTVELFCDNEWVADTTIRLEEPF